MYLWLNEAHLKVQTGGVMELPLPPDSDGLVEVLRAYLVLTGKVPVLYLFGNYLTYMFNKNVAPNRVEIPPNDARKIINYASDFLLVDTGPIDLITTENETIRFNGGQALALAWGENNPERERLLIFPNDTKLGDGVPKLIENQLYYQLMMDMGK